METIFNLCVEALMWAAAEGHVDVIKLLLKHGADVSHQLDSGFDAFTFAVRNGHINVVRLLINAGVDVNKPMRTDGSTRSPTHQLSPLMLAVENGHFQLAHGIAFQIFFYDFLLQFLCHCL